MHKNQETNNSEFSMELRLILLLIQEDRDGLDIFLEAEGSLIDWEEFVNLVVHHRIYSLIYKNILRTDEPKFPQSVKEDLYNRYVKNSYWMLHLSREMGIIFKEFTKNNIQAIILKGPNLATELYGDLTLRTSKDIDILVSRDELPKAEKILSELGYVNEDSDVLLKERKKWSEHNTSHINNNKKVQVELHWRLSPDNINEPEFKKLWENRKVIDSKYNINTLGDIDLFVYLALHGSRHGWFRLRWLLDIDKLIRKGLDWDGLSKFMNHYKCSQNVGQAIILSTKFFNSPVSEENRLIFFSKNSAYLAKLSLPFILETINFKSLSAKLSIYFRFYLYKIKPPSNRFFFIASQFYPNIRDIQTIKLPKSLRFIYFPLKPLLWFWRRVRRRFI